MDKGFPSTSGNGMQGAGTSGMGEAISMRGKRALQNGEVDSDNDVERLQNRQRRVLLNTLALGPLPQHFCEMVEPMLRTVVGDETEKALSRLISYGRISLPRQIRCANSRTLSLHFKSKIATSIFTQDKVKDCQGSPICIELRDRATGVVVAKGQESVAKLELVALKGDFSSNVNEDWCQEDFETSVVKERKEKGPLLFGNLTIVLKEGVGTLGDVTFTDNSSWTKSKTFALGVRLAAESSPCLSIREGKSGAFKVKECRGKYYKKHHSPAPAADVWRLENIKQDGPSHKKLMDKGIKPVEQFQRFVKRDPQTARNSFGSRMSDKVWQATLAHAQRCNYNYKPVENMSVELCTDNNELAREIYETNSKIDSGNMLICEKMHEVKGVGCHGKESGSAILCCNANPAFVTTNAVQNQQSAQHSPISKTEVLFQGALICSPMCSNKEGTIVEASTCTFPYHDFQSPQTSQEGLEISVAQLNDTFANNTKQDENAILCCNANPAFVTTNAVQDQQSAQHSPISETEVLFQGTLICSPMCSNNEGFVMSTTVEASTCTFPCHDVQSPQTSQEVLEIFVAQLNDTSANNTKQDENASNQELLQIPGTSNLPGEWLPVLQSFPLSPADTRGMYNGDILGNSSERRKKFKVVLLSIRFAIKCLQVYEE